MQTSERGRGFIEKEEGLRLEAYQDAGGIWTIGYGETENVTPGMVISESEADQRFATRLAQDFEPGVLTAIGDAPTTQGQFDAMVSLAYNIGVEAFEHSTVRREHVAGDYEAAADAFLMWTKVGGRELPALRRRRLEESDIYMSDLPKEEPNG